MSHVQGHVDEPIGSCGVCHLVFDGETSLSFVLPPFRVKKDDRIGFHPVYLDKEHTTVIAVDVVLWSDHEAAEAIAKGQMPGAFDKIEEVHGDTSKKAGLEAVLVNAGLKEHQKDVIRKTLDYFNNPDFESFYVKNGKGDTANAEAEIKRVMGK